MHSCPAEGCSRRVPFDRLACAPHWFQLPHALRTRILAAWRSGDLAAHTELRADAVAFWAAA